MTLHEAIEKVLKEAGEPLSAREIAEKINSNKLYFRGDMEPVPSSQIHARVKNYPAWFIKTEEGLIRLAADRIDPFRDAVSQVLDSLRSPYILDVNYLLAALFFYKRWLDYPEMLQDYSLDIEIDKTDSLSPDAFRSFYNNLKYQLSQRGKNFDTEIIDNLFIGNHDLFHDALTSIGTALKVLGKISFNIKSYTVNDFGKRFSELFTGSYANIKKTGEYSTPESLRELMISLVHAGPDDLVYNPAAGYFTFPAALQRRSGAKISFYGEELNTRVYSLGLLNLFSNGALIENAYHANSITSSVIKDESAAAVICNPPFNMKQDYSLYDELYPFKSKNSILFFLQLAIKKLKPGGEVIIVIPESILFAELSGVMRFRKYLIENNLVDSVISLPSGTFEPYSMVKSSILILKKERPIDKILFFDAGRNEYISGNNLNKTKFNAGMVSSHFTRIREKCNKNQAGIPAFNWGEMAVHEDQADYINHSKNYVLVSNKDIRENEYILEVKRYFLENIDNTIQENGAGRIVELKSILKQYRSRITTCAESGFPYLSISNLNADFTKFGFENYDKLRNDPKLRGQLVENDIIMAGSIAGSLKPTFFKFRGRKVLLSRDIFAFIPDYDKVDPEYLIYELYGDHVNEQIKLLARGTAVKYISSKDFLRIKIRLPESLDEQRKIVIAKKEALVHTRMKEAENLASSLKVSASDERKMLGAFKHELSPLASSLKGNIQTLGKFLIRKIEEDKVPQLSDKVSAAALSRDLKGLLSDMVNSADNLHGLTERISQILDVTKEDINYESVFIKKFIKEQVTKWEHKDIYNIVFHGEEKEAPDVEYALNRDQFAILVRNFLENTNKHGYINKTEKYDLSKLTGPSRNIVFNAFRQEESVIIEMINDGESFPADFTFKDFVSFGGRGGSSKGSGIGGFLMKKIVDNHMGELKLIESGRSLTIPRNIKTGGNCPSAEQQIRAGIYFRIILHEKYLWNAKG